MKFIFALTLCFSISALAQGFKTPEGKEHFRNLKLVKENHQYILKSYKNQIDSEILRLVEGIEYESGNSKNAIKMPAYYNLLVNLLVKRIFVSELQKQLAPVDLDRHVQLRPYRPVFNTEKIKIDLKKEINIELDNVLDRENLAVQFLKDLRNGIIEDLVKGIAKKTYQAIGSGLLTKMVTDSVSTAALRSTLISLGSEAFVSAGTAAIINIVTMPLMAYRNPAETVWADILWKHPELILNPEWMKYAGSSDEPWSTHHYAILRRTERMERALDSFLKKEEREFQAQVIKIWKAAPVKQEYLPHTSVKQDATYVQRPYVEEIAPFWAQFKK